MYSLRERKFFPSFLMFFSHLRMNHHSLLEVKNSVAVASHSNEMRQHRTNVLERLLQYLVSDQLEINVCKYNKLVRRVKAT